MPQILDTDEIRYSSVPRQRDVPAYHLLEHIDDEL